MFKNRNFASLAKEAQVYCPAWQKIRVRSCLRSRHQDVGKQSRTPEKSLAETFFMSLFS